MDNFKTFLDQHCSLTAAGQPVSKPLPTLAGKAKTADIYLMGVIGGYEANLPRFRGDLEAAGKVDKLTVYLNTIGGNFADGLPIYNLLAQHPAHVTVKVMGYALSIGSVIMLAADRIECAENGLVMIHRAQGFTYGDAGDHQKTAEILTKHEAAVIPRYAAKMGKTHSEVQALLNAETWYTAAEALQAGLVDAISGKAEADAAEQAGMQADGQAIMQHYRHVPRQLAQGAGYS